MLRPSGAKCGSEYRTCSFLPAATCETVPAARSSTKICDSRFEISLVNSTLPLSAAMSLGATAPSACHATRTFFGSFGSPTRIAYWPEPFTARDHAASLPSLLNTGSPLRVPGSVSCVGSPVSPCA
jgi:hypothetical protein